MESECHKFLVRQKFINFLKYIYYTYCLYICIQKYTYLLCLIKVRERTNKRDGEIGKHKLNEMGALNMKRQKSTCS